MSLPSAATEDAVHDTAPFFAFAGLAAGHGVVDQNGFLPDDLNLLPPDHNIVLMAHQPHAFRPAVDDDGHQLAVQVSTSTSSTQPRRVPSQTLMTSLLCMSVILQSIHVPPLVSYYSICGGQAVHAFLMEASCQSGAGVV